jgi:TgpA N-terminal domain/Transglutaminase-like superfamily
VNARLTVAAGLATVLASIALYPLLAGGIWFWGGIGAVIVAGGIGAAGRRYSVPAGVCFLAAVGGEFLYLNVLFAHRQSWLGVVPTGASVQRLRLLVTQAAAETSHGTPPVPARPGIVLVIVAGIGLVGALTDLHAVRLHQPAIAGVPLLVLFCVPLTTGVKPGVVGTALVFCAGVAGYLALLSADGRYRLRLWGRVIHPWQGDEEDEDPDTRPLGVTGRRIGFAAVVLALFLPLLVPAARAHRLFDGLSRGGGGGGGQGPSGPVSFPRPLDLLNTDLQDSHPQAVLSYTATGPGTPPYLQLYVLGDVTTSGWKMAPAGGTRALGSGGVLPAAPGLTAATSAPLVHEVISLASGLANGGNVSYLPLPYPARQVKGMSGSWQVDPGSLMVHSTDARLAGLRYIVTGENLTPTPQQLRHAGPPPAAVAAYTRVPAAFDQLRALADRLTKGQTSAYDKAVALQAWFHRPGNFTYSVRANSGTGARALARFLSGTKTGSCQQFAFGMAVLARLLGIPSRVVVGFTQGTFVGRDTWRVETSDAHAWPELYFSGAGWLGFEPTPPSQGGQPGQGTATVPAYSDPQHFPGGAPHSQTGQNPGGPAPSPASSHSPAGLPGKLTNQGAGPSGTGTSRGSGPAPIGAIAIALLAVLLLTPGVARIAVRRWRWRRARDDVARAHVAWRELRDDLADHRIIWQASESPRALARRITKSLGLAGAEREALARVARAEERASYAASPAGSAGLRADVALVRRAVTRACPLPARWSARVAPSSALAPARAGLRHALDVFGWLELATTRARARGPFRRRAPGDARSGA